MKEFILKHVVKQALLTALLFMFVYVFKSRNVQTIIIQNYEDVRIQRDRRYIFSRNALYVKIKNSIKGQIYKYPENNMFLYVSQDVVQEQKLEQQHSHKYQRYHYVPCSPELVPQHLADLLIEQIYKREQKKAEMIHLNSEEDYKMPLQSAQYLKQQELEAQSPGQTLFAS